MHPLAAWAIVLQSKIAPILSQYCCFSEIKLQNQKLDLKHLISRGDKQHNRIGTSIKSIRTVKFWDLNFEETRKRYIASKHRTLKGNDMMCKKLEIKNNYNDRKIFTQTWPMSPLTLDNTEMLNLLHAN